MSKKNIESLKKNAKDLESILMGITDEGIDSVEGNKNLPKLRAIAPLDYDMVKSEADKRASDIVESIILMYLPEEFVIEQDYVYQKMEVDKITLSNLLFQMKTAEHAIKKILEEIDSGSLRDRTFEVLSALQKSKMEIVKHLSSFMVILENNYKNLMYDWKNIVEKREIMSNASDAIVVEEESTKFRGTKNLMTMVQTYVDAAKNKNVDGSEADKV